MSADADFLTPAGFVLHEARLLNEARYDDWLALFVPEGRYWVPLQGALQDGSRLQASIADEDAVLLAVRIARLKHARAFSMDQGVRSLHVVQQQQLDQADEERQEYRLTTCFHYTEVKGQRQFTLAGTWRHHLRRTPLGLRIVEKRVDLLNAGAAHEAIHLFP